MLNVGSVDQKSEIGCCVAIVMGNLERNIKNPNDLYLLTIGVQLGGRRVQSVVSTCAPCRMEHEFLSTIALIMVGEDDMLLPANH